MNFNELDAFTRSYIETAIWISTVPGDNPNCDDPMDDEYSASDLAEETLRRMADECEQFQEEALKLVWAATKLTMNRKEQEQMGHDFWLTRNGHGAGFWDGDYPEPLGQELTELSKSYGECSLYVGDDGQIYQF